MTRNILLTSPDVLGIERPLRYYSVQTESGRSYCEALQSMEASTRFILSRFSIDEIIVLDGKDPLDPAKNKEPVCLKDAGALYGADPLTLSAYGLYRSRIAQFADGLSLEQKEVDAFLSDDLRAVVADFIGDYLKKQQKELNSLFDDLASDSKVYEQFMKGKTVPKATLAGIIIAAIIIALVVFVVILQSAERRIPVQYSNKIQGRRQVGGNSSVIPMKVNTAGVIPVIFAQSLLQTPIMLVQLFAKNGVTGFWGKVLNAMNQSNWFNPGNWVNTIGAVVYVLLIIGFAYFYTEITFNPLEIAENLKRSGGFIPGIRPGKPTSDYLTSILKHIIFIGAIGLSIVAILPLIFNGLLGASVSFGGTSIIIIVGVIVETLKQVESQMMVRNYKGFLND